MRRFSVACGGVGRCLWALAFGLLLACGGGTSESPSSDASDVAGTRAPEAVEESQALASTPASLVLISIDTLRSDHVGTYGGAVETPHLDALAAEGIVFERAYSHVPLTLPAHLSMLTGLLLCLSFFEDHFSQSP